MNIKNFMESKSVSKVILALSILLVILVIFQAGFMVGYHKGNFTRNFESNYTMRGFNDPRSFFAPFMHGGDDINPHGAAGTIVSMNLPIIMVKGPNRAEEVIVVDQNTTVRNLRQTASTSDLSVGKQIVVIGKPNEDGQIKAELIRIMPSSPFTNPSTDLLPATSTKTNR